MRCSALLLPALLLGCTVEPADVPMTPADEAAVMVAAGWWSVHTNDAHQVSCVTPELCFVGGETWTVHRVVSVAIWCHDPGGCAAVTRRLYNRIELGPGSVGEEQVLLQHEMGHALGLEHTADGVMQFPFHSDRFTDSVGAECRRVGAC